MCGEQPDSRVLKDLLLSRDQKAGQCNQQALPNSSLVNPESSIVN